MNYETQVASIIIDQSIKKELIVFFSDILTHYDVKLYNNYYKIYEDHILLTNVMGNKRDVVSFILKWESMKKGII